jgi:PIN domain nuclease of toxin-antitoxin system
VVSAISVWELFMLVKKGRLKLEAGPSAFVSATHRDPKFRIEPIDEMVCRRSVELPDLHSDPADRIILATAGELGCSLVSKDSRMRDYNLVPVIW